MIDIRKSIMSASSITSLKQEYTEALIESILRTNPTWNISQQTNEITTEVNNMFFNLSRVGSEEQIIEGINNYIRINGDLNTLTTHDLLFMINPTQLNIPINTYGLIDKSINQNKSVLILISLTIKAIGLLPQSLQSFDPALNINTKELNEGTYCYLYQNILSIVADPIPESFKIVRLLLSDSIDQIISQIENFYGPFGALKYLDITNINYVHPINIITSNTNLPEATTTIISQRLQINPSDITYDVNQLTDEQLSALLITIDNFPRLRTAPIKLGLEQLDMFIVDGLMTTKFQMVKRYYVGLFRLNLQKEANKIFSRVLLDQNMKVYSPVMLEMNYQSSAVNRSVITNINRSKVPAMKPVQNFMNTT